MFRVVAKVKIWWWFVTVKDIIRVNVACKENTHKLDQIIFYIKTYFFVNLIKVLNLRDLGNHWINNLEWNFIFLM